MTTQSNNTTVAAGNNDPASWNHDELQQAWHAQLEAALHEGAADLPIERLVHQLARQQRAVEIIKTWSEIKAEQRQTAWQELCELATSEAARVLPECVRCGTCCMKSSPTLLHEDLELVLSERIPWPRLLTLRVGEPVRSPFNNELFDLKNEQIKLLERPQDGSCVFYDTTQMQCTIYASRPLQCHAQACWDTAAAEALEQRPRLTRQEILESLPILAKLVQEHEKQCSFAAMQDAMEALTQNKDGAVDQILDLLCKDETFRTLAQEQFKIPVAIHDFLFGRPMEQLVELFGMSVDHSSDGLRFLRPLETDED